MYKEEKVFLAPIKERFCLNPGSEKETYHLVVDLEGSGIEYAVGDCLGIYPENGAETVKKIISQFQARESTEIVDRDNNTYRLGEFLRKKANLARLPKQENLSLSDFCRALPPLLPRFYSIASSQMVVGNEAHLTVRLIDGICSNLLCKAAPLNVPCLPLFHHRSRQFTLPVDSFDKPIVMIGPGTGIAPFRGFMQERIARGSQAENWLFFGERYSRKDFYYQNFWESLISKGKLTLDCAFSRDQIEKVYVQHKIFDKGAQLWDWLQKKAYLFVCGDASKMAKDVDKTLLAIFEKEGGLSLAESRSFMKELKGCGRYQRDVY